MPVNTVKREDRRWGAAGRLAAALADPGHVWKNDDGPDKAKVCLANLAVRGVKP